MSAHLTSDERAVMQALMARGVTRQDAEQDALDGVLIDDAREVSKGQTIQRKATP